MLPLAPHTHLKTLLLTNVEIHHIHNIHHFFLYSCQVINQMKRGFLCSKRSVMNLYSAVNQLEFVIMITEKVSRFEIINFYLKNQNFKEIGAFCLVLFSFSNFLKVCLAGNKQSKIEQSRNILFLAQFSNFCPILCHYTSFKQIIQ